ncbi:MAG: glycosyltransferase family 4 protein [Methanospirillum sp.]|nr:glycosyltransferase family 4 protein [Methanospirillum sp.]
MPNIAYIVDEFFPHIRGGLGTYAMEITGRLLSEDLHPVIFTRNTGDDPVSDLWNAIPVYRPVLLSLGDTLPLLSPLDVQSWDKDGQNFFLETVLYNYLSADHLVRIICREKKKRIDLVVSHDWMAAPAGLLIRQNLKIPLVFHYHSTEQGRVEKPSPIVELIEKTAAKMADVIITVSHAMKDELVRTGYQEEKITVIHNGVDIRRYDPGLFSREMISAFRDRIGLGDCPMILFVGRLTRVKGVDELVRAMPLVTREIPDARLVILGVGEMLGEIRSLVDELNLSGQVIIHDRFVPERERLLYYASCDCAVFPSKYEPFGLVCTEAMSMAKPVVVGATGTSGFKEQVITDGPDQCGYHINPWNPSDIAKYLCILLSDRERMQQLGLAGRRRAVEYFSAEKTARMTGDIYRKAIAQSDGVLRGGR